MLILNDEDGLQQADLACPVNPISRSRAVLIPGGQTSPKISLQQALTREPAPGKIPHAGGSLCLRELCCSLHLQYSLLPLDDAWVREGNDHKPGLSSCPARL